MRNKVVLILLTFLFAFVILFVSILRTASVIPRFSTYVPDKVTSELAVSDNTEKEYVDVYYRLVFPGTVLPDNNLWPLKALRDKIWLTLTTSPTKKADLYLLFADKRLGSAKILFEEKNYEDGYTTLQKAEKYLELACIQEQKNRKAGYDTNEFLERLANASLMHRLVIEEIHDLTPEEIKPNVIMIQDYPISAFKKISDTLNSKGITPPKNPFE